jgi:hypothetical protein
VVSGNAVSVRRCTRVLPAHHGTHIDPHRRRIYTNGGRDYSGKGKETGATRWDCYIEELDADGNNAYVASLWLITITNLDGLWEVRAGLTRLAS